jgi:hypothetical protein
MEPFNTNQNPVAAGSQMPVSPGGEPKPDRKPVGPIAGAIIVIILLVAGGLYFYGAKLNSQMQPQEMPYIPDDDYMMPEGSMPVSEAQSDTEAGLPPQGSSDDVSSIESDFNAMNMQQMESQNEAELNNI